MELAEADRRLVEAYFDAMRRGAAAENDLLALFTDDAVYVEPFSGQVRTHVGKARIRACFRGSWDDGPPDLTLQVHRIDLEGDQVRAEWTCDAPAFPAPVRGQDVYTITGGRIARLEVSFL